MTTITAFISPYREDRAMARAIIGSEKFIEVHVSTPASVCESRDPKGPYAKAGSGQIPEFTGISSPYEPPLLPALVLETNTLPLMDAARILYHHLAQRFG